MFVKESQGPSSKVLEKAQFGPLVGSKLLIGESKNLSSN